MAKPIWLSEEQLGDLIWAKKEEFFHSDEFHEWHREFQIGYGRVDFACFDKNVVDLFELKITATMDSVLQIVKYKRHFDEYIRQAFYYGTEAGSEKQAPECSINLIARYFDSKVIDMCIEFNIAMWRIDVHSPIEISIDLEDFDLLPMVPESQIPNKLRKLYLVRNVE